MSVEPDPLEKITMRPRTFAGLLACVALVTGLLLGLLPVRVSTPDIATPRKVSCGNTLGGVDAPRLSSSLGRPDQEILVDYIVLCDRAIDDRALPAWTLFFGGMAGLLWLGVVRRGQAGTQGDPQLGDPEPDRPE